MSKDLGEAQPVVQVYKSRNKLKDKLGVRAPSDEPGELAEESIAEADAIIEDLCKNCLDNIGQNLESLIRVWDEMQSMVMSEARDEKEQELFTFAHEIKDIASLCGYSLAAHFAESLRDYIAETTYDLKNQRVIVQAHVDALRVVHKNKIKDDAGPAAEELKAMVKVAISKYK